MKPRKEDLHPIYQGYLNLVLQDNLEEALSDNSASWKFYASIPDNKIDYTYAAGKWSVKQVVAHLIDSERFFNKTALDLVGRSWSDLVTDQWIGTHTEPFKWNELLELFQEERRRSMAIWKTFSVDEYAIPTEIFGKKISLLGLGFNCVGHEIHHQRILQERYL